MVCHRPECVPGAAHTHSPHCADIQSDAVITAVLHLQARSGEYPSKGLKNAVYDDGSIDLIG